MSQLAFEDRGDPLRVQCKEPLESVSYKIKTCPQKS